MNLKNFEAVQITIIKRFKFLEPIFYPKKLKKGFRFLSDAEETRKIINRMESKEVNELGKLKPIRNLNIPKDNFWRPFVLPPTPTALTRQPLFYYPFQILFDKEKVHFELDIDHLSEVLNCQIKDAKVVIQARLFPPGIGTLHLRLYLQPAEMDIAALSKITLDKRNIKVNYVGRKLDSLEFLDNIANALTQKIVSEPGPTLINGHYTIYNFQGKPIRNVDAETFIKTLSGKKSISGNIMRGRCDSDLFYVSNRMAIMYIDDGLAKTRTNVLPGRRCFRHHFINSIELAYITRVLVEEYANKSERILQEIKTAGADRNVLRRTFKIHVVNPGFFATLWSSISRVSELLNETNRRWSTIYEAVAFQLELGKELTRLDDAISELFEQAKQVRGILVLPPRMYDELKFWTKRSIDALSAFIPGKK